MRAPRSQCSLPQMNNRIPGQLKKFTTMAVINPPEKKLAIRTSVKWCDFQKYKVYETVLYFYSPYIIKRAHHRTFLERLWAPDCVIFVL